MAENLPPEIFVEIFSRLPAESVLTCKLVSKTWNYYISLTKNTNFSENQLQQQIRVDNSKVIPGFVFLIRSEIFNQKFYSLYYGEYQQEENDSCVRQTIKLIDHPYILTKEYYNRTDVLVGSCNGLLCLAESKKSDLKDPIHICNPITGECVYLQGYKVSMDDHKSVRKIYSGFGYSRRTNEHKVVRISVGTKFMGQVQVQTIGSNDWRNKGDIANVRFEPKYGIYANGALHWLNCKDRTLMIFNLADETFNVLPFHHRYYRSVRFLRSWGEAENLYGVGVKYESLDIWSLKNTESNGTTINSWSKVCTIPSIYTPIAVTNTGLVAVHSSPSPRTMAVSYYDPETKSVTPLGELKNALEIIPHTNSFVSLPHVCSPQTLRRLVLEFVLDSCITFQLGTFAL